MGQVEKKSMHTKIIVGAGAVILVLNLIDPASMIAKKSKEEAAVKNVQTQSSSAQFSSASNPNISWFDKFFCRGRTGSTFCSDKVLHPKANEIYKREALEPSPEDESIGAYTFQEKNMY